MKIAIVTGASSGLGTEFVKALVTEGPKVDEIWAIARRADRLTALRDAFGAERIRPMPMDLTLTDSFEALRETLEAEQPEIAVLINTAGFGTLGDFDKAELFTQTRMTDLNVRALTAITSAALPYMKRGGFIVNVCSIAAFAPNPRMTVYCSTKAYVYSFSKSLRFELKPKGINVLALCPGPMDTEFLPVAGIEKGASHTFDTLPRVSPEKAARRALQKAAAGRGIYTPRAFFKLYRFLAKILPHGFVMKLSKA